MDENGHGPQQQAVSGREPVFLLPGAVTAIAALFVVIHLASTLVLNPEGQVEFLFWFAFQPLRILAAPGLDDPGPLRGCDFVVLPGISGVHLTAGASYYTAANGGGTALEAGDSLWQDTRIYLFDSNGLCSDEKVIDIRIGTASTLTVSSALCPGEVYEIAGERFDEQRSSGSVILPGTNRFGCDSVIQVSISYFPAAPGRLDMALCPGENLVVHGETFDAARPEGSVLLPGAGSHGDEPAHVH